MGNACIRMAAGLAVGLSSLSFLGVIGLVTPEADAQQRIMRRGGPGGGMRMGGGGFRQRSEKPPVTADELTNYAEILNLDAAQRDVLAQLHVELLDSVAKLAGERETKMDEIRKTFEEKKDPAVFMEELPKIMESLRERRDAAEVTFFDDLQLLLSAEQEGNWDTMQRTRRRERTLAPGMIPGDAVDLIAVAKDMEIADRDGVPPLLETYAFELDSKLQARNAANPSEGGFRGMMRMEIDPEEMAEQMEKRRDAAFALRDLNQKYVRLISENISTEEREALASIVHEASFPRVYREGRTRRAFDMVLGMEDLDDDQRARIDVLFDRFNKNAAALNKDWSDALAKEAESGGGSTFTFGSGGRQAEISIGGSGDEVPESVAARQARRDLDNDMYSALRDILREDQQERLPERGEGGSGEWNAGGNVVFMSEDMVHGEGGETGVQVMVLELNEEDGEGTGEDVDIHLELEVEDGGEGMIIIEEEVEDGASDGDDGDGL